MFVRFFRPLRKVTAARFYSQTPSGAVGTSSKQTNSKFDKSIIKPILVVVMFGTMLSHVMNQQRLAGEMERRYLLKMEILKDLIEKAKRGEGNINVKEELKLVNKLFERTKEARFLDEKEAEKLSQISSSQNYSEAEVLRSMNNSTRALEKESLDDILKNIMDEMSDEPKSSAFKSNSEPKQQQSGELITDKDTLKEKAEYERELLQYKPSTDVHLIVQNPGELSSAAEDTKVRKFL
ncbi:hypothetical protein ZYGR_0AL00180 [Zygosaccharomyces rouxii]|uniref:Uncharacterized protein n=1 Tax=Zygosaccharomyces rouxii TaxID=4956 RepID=A0A1Q3AEU4_ZYGRO|nr:hypothetical protein ZYGR_0AL00180 [Zygosaccharomyces rouxii]